MSSSPSFVKPLLLNLATIKQDAEFLMNDNYIQYKLPTYRIFINGYPCKVLIDSGASANYIHSSILPFVSRTIPAYNGQSVETAKGQQTVIKSIAEFSIALKSYTDRIQAYVFDTKFGVILGRLWLAQVQPISDWFNGT